MTFISGVVAPIALLTLSIAMRSWWIVLALILYVGIFATSKTARRLARAGGVAPSCRHPPVVLGGGWSWILRRRAWPPNRIACRSGRSARGPGWWHAGTTIGEVQDELAREGRTLAGHPSILSATLGGWIGSKSHGSGGSLWTPTMGRVAVEAHEDGTRRILASKSAVDVTRAIVREVELLSVPNVVCERRVTYLTSEGDVARELFATPTHLRAVFVDRLQSLCVTWIPTPTQTPPTASWEFPPLWLTTALPARARRGWNTERWTRRMTLRDANAFGPEPPFLLATAAIATHTNFELFVTEPTTPRLIWRICTEFRALFDGGSLMGRLELRFGRTIQFLDFDVLRFVGDTSVVFRTIRKIYGANARFSLHPGKAQVHDFALSTVET